MDSDDTGLRRWVEDNDSSPYVVGRTLEWLKVKQPHYREGERGWEPTAKL